MRLPGFLARRRSAPGPATPRARQLPPELARVRTFFVLGMGRSGTNFLAHLLATCEQASVHHEPVPADFEAQVEAQTSADAALDYVWSRLPAMAQLIAPDTAVYGEVNSLLRFHGAALRSVLPDATLVHLVRDGRDVVRSVLERRHYLPGATGHHALHPLPDDPIADRWDELPRFGRVCWMWADANRRLRALGLPVVRFEELTADFEHFHDQLLVPCGLHLDEATWRGAVQRPTNTTERFTSPPWSEWTADQQELFEQICGPEMRALGYSDR